MERQHFAEYFLNLTNSLKKLPKWQKSTELVTLGWIHSEFKLD